jgi:hypothetical protein
MEDTKMEIAKISLSKGATAVGNTDGTVSINYTPPAAGKILWSANYEIGDMREWYAPGVLGAPNAGSPGGNNGGGEFDSGSYAPAIVTTEQAHSGTRSAKLSINAATQASGVRLFRWLEPQARADLYYSKWFYFPQRYTFAGWSNFFQFKSKSPSSIGGVDPIFYLAAMTRPATGNPYLRLEWWNQLLIPGPFPVVGPRVWEQTLADIPIGRWFKLEAHYVSAGDFTGRITVWQDDVLLFDLQGIRTRYPDGDTQWASCAYGQGITPQPTVVYVDDAAISTDRIANSQP